MSEQGCWKVERLAIFVPGVDEAIIAEQPEEAEEKPAAEIEEAEVGE